MSAVFDALWNTLHNDIPATDLSELDDHPEAQTLFESIEDLTSRVFDAAQTLRRSDEAEVLSADGDLVVRFTPETLAEFVGMRVVRPFLDKAIADNALVRMTEASERVVQLLPLLVGVQLPPPAEYYLNRVGLLYVWGYDIEIFTMARSVLEFGLQSRMTDEQVRDLAGTKDRYVVLKDRIKAAHKGRLLSEEMAKRADDIREAANDILHKAPKPGSSIEGPLDLITALRDVLTVLFTV
jgi:hypothetical protein